MRFLICDIRRLFSRKAMVVLFVFAPAVVVLLFSIILAPLIFTGKGLHFNFALLQEDRSLEVRSFVFQIVHSQSLSGLVSLYPVDSLDDGMAMLMKDEVSVFMHIPSGILEGIRRQDTVRITIYSTQEHALELSLISMTLGQSMKMVGQGQNQMEVSKKIVMSKGVSLREADIFLRSTTIEAMAQYMNRRRILGTSGSLSPLGEYLPVEYYLAAIFTLFAAFAMLPLIHFSAADLSGSILRRGLACGRSTISFYLSRLFSGTLFVLLVLLMIFPVAFMLELGDEFIGKASHGSLPSLLMTILLAALCMSALAAALAAWIGKTQPALWTGFYLVMGMAVASGVIIPDASLPAYVTAVGRFLPLRAAMRSLASSLFDYDPLTFWPDILKTAAAIACLLPVGLWGFIRKARNL